MPQEWKTRELSDFIVCLPFRSLKTEPVLSISKLAVMEVLMKGRNCGIGSVRIAPSNAAARQRTNFVQGKQSFSPPSLMMELQAKMKTDHNNSYSRASWYLVHPNTVGFMFAIPMAPALPSASDPDISKSDTISSSFLKTVCLVDWWLIKTEKDFCGKRLAVGGITSKEQQAVRAFSSSPIFKKYDAFTLETADGITVMVKGLINRDRTLQNGFPSEVCSHFLFGFPYDWETYSGEYFHRESTISNVPLNSPVYGECNDDTRNSEEISNSGNCSCEAIEDKVPSVPISSNVKNIRPSKVNVLVQLEPPTNFPAVSSRKLTVSNGNGKHSTKNKNEDGSKGKDEIRRVDLVEEALSGGNISGFARRGLKGTAEQSLVTTPNIVRSKISKRSVDPTVVIGLKMNVSSPSDLKQNKYPDRRVSDRLKNLKSYQKENSDSTLYLTNEDNKPNSMIETFDNPTAEKMAAGKSEPTKNPSGRKTNSSKGIHRHSGTRQSSYGLRNLKNKFNKDQAAGYSHETETDEVNPVSVDSVLVNNITKDIGHKSKRKSALDLPDVGLKEMKAGEVDSMYQQHWTQLDNMSSLSPESVKEPECLIVTDQGNSETTNQIEDKEPDCVKATDCSGAESTNQVEDSWSPITSGDVKHTDYLKLSAGAGERSTEELSTSGKKTKRKLDYNPHACSTHHRMKECSIVSPESLSNRRSKLGRVLLPPLAFWDNQHVVYDADGHIIGIRNGLTKGESSAGSKSGAMKRKKRLI
ncbi:kinetochore-associated protein KNL-2 homolog [Telopea speciosissima]|uniref:kinetochore-associated protein KNL-2 homolog n=1 Tax=Telopea speciosissima TaxID=54955 RepID=UPI001CC39BE4|nr:kinetochore-associated protein KNL-2 homolog [Telopea speciosissima]